MATAPTSVAAKVPSQALPTAAEIAAARTPQGGWTKAQLAEWGVPWPPPKGWRERLEKAALRRSRDPIDRARRLYTDARLLEDLCANERGKEIARDVALMALDLMAEARGGLADA